jgi:protein phosphatase
MRVGFGALSHPGRVRLNNEDHFSVVRRRRSREVLLTNLPEQVVPKAMHDDVYAMAVADGIGGAAFGELASMLALQAGWDLTTHAFKWHFQVNEDEAEELKKLLKVYGQLIHRRLQDEAAHDPRLAGMGTTISGALAIGTELFIAHVGDSRAYLFHGGSLKQLTRDHTLAQSLVDSGMLPSVSAASRRMRNMLVNCLGESRSEVEVDVQQVTLADGDQLLLCTDGLTDMVSDAEIAQVLCTRPEPDSARTQARRTGVGTRRQRQCDRCPRAVRRRTRMIQPKGATPSRLQCNDFPATLPATSPKPIGRGFDSGMRTSHRSSPIDSRHSQ